MQRKSVFIFETSLEEDKHGLHNECEIIIIAIFPKKTQCIKEIWPNNKKKGVALLFWDECALVFSLDLTCSQHKDTIVWVYCVVIN